MTSGSLWNYYRDEVNDSAIENNDDSNKISNNKTVTSKSFEYKTKIIAGTPEDNTLYAEVVVSLKYLSSFWRSLDLPIINCKIELDLSCSKKCVISGILITHAMPGKPNANPIVPDVAAIQTTGASFQINDAKL